MKKASLLPCGVGGALGRLLPLLLLPLLTGCMLSGLVSDEANATGLSKPAPAGIIVPTEAKSGQNRALVVRYALKADSSIHFQKYVFLQIPTDDGLRPAWPFNYTGTARTPTEILADLPASQRAELQKARLTLAGNAGHAPSRFGGFRPIVNPVPGTVERGQGLLRDTVTLFCLRFNPDGSLTEYLPADHETFPDNAFPLIVPSETERPEADVKLAKTRAVLMAPVIAPAELIFDPAVFGLFLIRGGC